MRPTIEQLQDALAARNAEIELLKRTANDKCKEREELQAGIDAREDLLKTLHEANTQWLLENDTLRKEAIECEKDRAWALRNMRRQTELVKKLTDAKP